VLSCQDPSRERPVAAGQGSDHRREDSPPGTLPEVDARATAGKTCSGGKLSGKAGVDIAMVPDIIMA